MSVTIATCFTMIPSFGRLIRHFEDFSTNAKHKLPLHVIKQMKYALRLGMTLTHVIFSIKSHIATRDMP